MTVLKMFILFMVFISIFHCDGEAPSLPFFCIGKFFSNFQLGDLGMHIFTINYCYISGERTTEC